MANPVRRLLIPAVIAGIVLGAAGTAAGYALLRPSTAQSSPGAGRDSILAALAQPTVAPTGQVRRFDLTIAETPWQILPDVTVDAIAFNGTVPGPTIRVTEGDTVEITVRNDLSEPTSVHWHGLHVPNDQDGVMGVTQPGIAPGSTFSYRFQAPHAGTFMYHAHGDRSREQIDRGLYAPFIIDPAGGDPLRPDVDVTLALQGWMVGDEMAGMDGMSMEYNYFTVNGSAFPSTAPIQANLGDLVRVRFINPSQTIHPMHLHGMDMVVVAKDGEPLPSLQRLNTLDIAQGETYEVVFRADSPGTWLLHCHDLHHVSNDGQEPGGLIVAISVAAPTGSASSAPPAAAPSTGAALPSMTDMPGMDH